MDHLGLWLFIGAVCLAGFGGLALLLGGLRRLVRGRLNAGLGRLLVGAVLLLAFAFVAAVALDLRTYLRLTHEQPVATLTFAALGPQDFRAVLTDAAGHESVTELRGDDWLLEARVIKWKGWATLLGLDPLYRLDRLEGRYRSIQQEQNDRHTAIPLAEDAGLDFWSLAHRGLPGVDASYGSGVYLPMADGAQYEVTLGTSGLIARPVNEAARRAAGAT